VTFSQETLRGLTTGSLQLVKRGDAVLLPVAADASGRFVEIGAIAGGVGVMAGGWPAVLVVAGAVAAAYAQQQWLEQTWGALDQKMTTIIERLQDTDHGRVEGAYSFVELFDRAIDDGVIPLQYRRELAAARRDVDAVYFSRRRYLDRVIERVDAAQGKDDGREGDSPKLTKEILEAFGSGPEVFESEVLLYLRAMIVRARLVNTTAILLAMDGHPEQAFELVERVVEGLRDDFFGLFRRMRGLTKHDLGRIPWRGRRELRDVVTGLHDLMDERLRPLVERTERWRSGDRRALAGV